MAWQTDVFGNIQREDRLFVFKLLQIHSFEAERVHDPQAAREAGCSWFCYRSWFWVANFGVVQIQIFLILGLFKNLLLQAASLRFCIAIIVLFNHNYMVCKRIHLHLCWSILGVQDLLGESFTQSFDLDDSELLPVDADDAFGALRRTKGAGLLERGIAHWGHAVLVHMAVAQVWSGAECKNSILSFHADFGKTYLLAYWFKTNEF